MRVYGDQDQSPYAYGDYMTCDPVVIGWLPVDLGDFKCLESIEYVLEDAHCFDCLRLVYWFGLVTIARQRQKDQCA